MDRRDSGRMPRLMVTPDKPHKSLLGGARIACSESPSSRKEASVSSRPQEHEMLTERGVNDDSGNLSSLSTSRISRGNSPGFTGLSNLGNTCFMNCVLQALANNKDLRDFFLTKRYVQDINEENPLGSRGKLARSFYWVLKHLWSGEDKSHSPVKFKAIIEKLAPQFMGFMQHDAQEFMAFFLDALHEDLNRVRLKPVFEIPQLEDQDQYFIASKSWSLHRSRNDSFIVDKFHGMYKSKLTCPACNKESTTFDPFLFLPVPIPKPRKWISVTFFSHTEGPIEESLCIPEEGAKASDILSFVSKKHRINTSCLRIFQTADGNVTKQFTSDSSLPPLGASPSFVVCQVVGDAHNHVTVLQRVIVQDSTCTQCGKSADEPGVKIMRCSKCKTSGYCSRDCQRNHWQKHRQKCSQQFIGCPFIVSLGMDLDYNSLTEDLLKMASYSVDIFHSSLETPGVLDCGNVYDPLTPSRHSFDIRWCHSGDLTKSFPLKDKLHNLNFSTVSHLIMEWSSDVTASEINIGKQNVKSHVPSIEDCIQLFTRPEVLATEEAWYCPKCKKHKEATKEISLWQLPDILIIQLKRFSFRNRIWRDKVDRLVKFPVSGLDMSPFCVTDQTESPIYDLFAVVNHHGGMFGGHYTSYVRLSEDCTDPDLGWRLCDDSCVTSVRSTKDLVTDSAYVMFYQRRKDLGGFILGRGDGSWSSNTEEQLDDLTRRNHISMAEEAKQAASDKVLLKPSGCHSKEEGATSVSCDTKSDSNALKVEPVPLTKTQPLDGVRSVPGPSPSCSSITSRQAGSQNVITQAGSLLPTGPLPYTDMDAVD